MSDTLETKNGPKVSTAEGELNAFKTIIESTDPKIVGYTPETELDEVIVEEMKKIKTEKEERAQQEAEQKALQKTLDHTRTTEIKIRLLKANTALEHALKNSSALSELVCDKWKQNWAKVWSAGYNDLLVLWLASVSQPAITAAICLSKRQAFADLKINHLQAYSIKLFWRPERVGDICQELYESRFHDIPKNFDEQLQKLADPAKLARMIVRALHT